MALNDLFDYILHIDVHLRAFAADNGSTTYALLAAIVFCETGLVVLPFLPGDSLLFAAGALCAPDEHGVHTHLQWEILVGILFLATFLGDNVNYAVGRLLGPRVLKGETGRWLNRKNLDRTHEFFVRHGRKSVVIARFVPIIRTFAPFVAGVGRMDYGRFLAFSLLGTTLWVAVFVSSGYFFGNIPFVQDNFKFVIVAIIVISLLPIAVEIIRARQAASAAAKPPPATRSGSHSSNERSAA